jgi:PPK2 family polyphosphate:nucleotide phosphotransferase
MNLKKTSTKAPDKLDKEKAKEETEKLIANIAERQKILYAQAKYSLLVILQGLDASGKDGVVTHLFRGMNPLGCQVKAFKKPTEEEFAHDFLWRIHHHTPEKGMIQIFNRSQYEDILVPSIEGYYSKDVIEKRYNQINQFESMLSENNTIVLKFYLHISHEEQAERLKERMTDSTKFWKHNDGDWTVAEKFDKYLACYETIFEKCNTIPWNIVPSDQNWYKSYLIAKKIEETLSHLDLQWPALETKMKH